MSRLNLIKLAVVLIIPSVSHAGGGHAHGPDGSHISESFDGGGGNLVTLTEEAAGNIGIQFMTVKLEAITPSRTLFGRIIADPRRVTAVSALFNGRIEKIYVLPGQYVRRDEDLIKVSPLQVGSKSVVLKADQDGYVTELNFSKGKVFNSTDSLLTVSDLSVVLFEGDIFDLGSTYDLQSATECSVHTKRFSGKHFSCSVETIDASFRGNPPVGHVHASIDNPDTELKPGMTGEIHLASGEPTPKITIPNEAVLGKFEQRFVFLKNGNSFMRKQIKIGELYGDNVEVTSGLIPGDQVVIQGHYQLQFAKSDATPNKDDDHDHSQHSDSHEHQAEEHDSNNSHDQQFEEQDHSHGSHGHEHDH